MTRRLSTLAALVALAGPAAWADTITLTNGRVIEAERAWYQGAEVRYEKDGGVYGVPRSLVLKLEQRARPEASSDPDVARARERLEAHDPVEATRLLRQAVARDPTSLPALHALIDAYLRLGDALSARDAALKALGLDDRHPRTRELLGDALLAMGDREGAHREYARSLLLKPDPEVERKLAEVAPPPADARAGAQFRLRYAGGVNEPMGVAVLEVLGAAYEDFSRRLGFRPEDPVTVVLQTDAEFQDAHTPEWADGVNDGTIRVASRGLARPTPRMLAVLRHELAHSFIAARTGGNCPTWLQEGVSQWLEGGDPGRVDAQLAERARAGRLSALLTLEGPFQALPPEDVATAYAESLSAVAYVLRRSGEAGVVRLLSALGDGLPADEALPVALALKYGDLQRGWEAHLRQIGARASG